MKTAGSRKKIGRISAVMFIAAACGAFAFFPWQRDDPAVRANSVAVEAPAVASEPTAVAQPPRADPDTPQAPHDAVLAAATVQRLVRDATAGDAAERANAIEALAAAPEATAIPVLQRALGGGDDIERQLALSSLHALALRHGDTGGAIRELLRQSIYDGGDEAVASGAQAALDDIERSSERHAAATDAMSTTDGAR